MLTAHRIQLDLNNVQRTYLARAAGVARFAYNWALTAWRRQYLAWKADPALPRPSEASLRRQLNAVKREKYPWMLDVTKCAPQMAIMQLGRAFENFFAGRARYPTYRRKGADDRVTISNDKFQVEGRRLRVPKLGWVHMREALRFSGHVVSACLSRTADHWYASITVDCPDSPHPPADNQGAVGVDLGVTRLATLSTGETIEGPKALQCKLDKLRRLSRALSRKVKGSANRAKARLKLARLHERITHRRREGLHQLTTSLTRRFCMIGIEDLNVRGMMRNPKLARLIADMGWSEFRRQIVHKAARRGGKVILVDRWYPSSKTCSACGHVLETLTLAQRSWNCPKCGTAHDRDINAAVNLMKMAVSSTVPACGGESAGLVHMRQAKLAPEKQESSVKADHG